MSPFATTLAPWQVADLWASLEDAYERRASYGSDTTEVYAYRLLPSNPTLDRALAERDFAETETGKDAIREAATLARDALVSVAAAFEERRECRITIEDMTIFGFSKSQGFVHRVRVQVIRKGES